MARRSDSGCLSAAIACVLILCLIGVQAYNIWHFVDKAIKARPPAPVASEQPPPEGADMVPPTPADADVVSAANGAMTRDRSLHVSGFYKPDRTVMIGSYGLTEIRLGPLVDFDNMETKGPSPDRDPPFVLVLDKFGETSFTSGGLRLKPVQIVCTTYEMTRDAVSCEGDDLQFGKISFKGRFDPAFVRKIAVNGKSPTFFHDAALTGDLKAGEVTVNLSLAYWAEE